MLAAAEPEPEPRSAFRAALGAAFARAAARAPVVERRLNVGPARWRLRLAGGALAGALLRALEHLRAPDAGGDDDLTVLGWDQAATGVALPPCPWTAPRLCGRGDLEHDWGAGVNAVFSTASRSLQYLDAPARFAAFWVHDPADLQPWERAAPLRALLAGWARAAGGFLIHGAGVGVGGQGVLLTGASGSGKSTTALACLVAGMDFAGDDFVMLRRAPGAGAAHGVQLHGLFGSAKVAASELDRPGDQGLAPLALLAPPRDPTDADGGKAILWINESHPASMARHLAVRAVIVPVPAAHAQPRLRPASPVEVLRALLPSSAFLSAGAERRSYAGAIDLVRGLPALVLELGRRRADNAQVIQRWLQVG